MDINHLRGTLQATMCSRSGAGAGKTQVCGGRIAPCASQCCLAPAGGAVCIRAQFLPWLVLSKAPFQCEMEESTETFKGKTTGPRSCHTAWLRRQKGAARIPSGTWEGRGGTPEGGALVVWTQQEGDGSARKERPVWG